MIGVIEIENDGYGPTSALQDLVDRLNAASAPGTYAFIDADAATGQLNALGTDAIKVGFVYRPGVRHAERGRRRAQHRRVRPLHALERRRHRPQPAGAGADLLRQRHGREGHGRRQPPQEQGLGCADNVSPVGPDPDTGDGQGECNLTRLAAAQELAAWLATDPTGSGDADQLVMGDLNAYRLEDPVRALNTAGFADLINAHIGLEGYSYAFDGEWGYLDHALGTASLAPQVTGVAEWHVNADEPAILDYNTEFKSAGQITSLYAPDEFRTSDHDPVVIGLDLDHAAPSADAGGPYAVNEGSTVTLNGTGSDPEGPRSASSGIWTATARSRRRPVGAVHRRRRAGQRAGRAPGDRRRRPDRHRQGHRDGAQRRADARAVDRPGGLVGVGVIVTDRRRIHRPRGARHPHRDDRLG